MKDTILIDKALRVKEVEMFTLDKGKAKRILVDELGFLPAKADVYLQNFPPIHDELAGAVEQWLEDRTVQDVKVSGVSIGEVMRVRGCQFLAAIRSLNRLLDDDMTVGRREQMTEDLRRPIRRW